MYFVGGICADSQGLYIYISKYLGETQQVFNSRKYQHEYTIKCKQCSNGLAQHLKKNKKHTTDWETECS